MSVVPSKYQPTDRDVSLLRDLWLMRYLSSSQLSRLHFGHLKLAQRRLRKLVTQQLVNRFRTPQAKGFGDQRWFYSLSRQGARVLARAEPIDERILLPSHLPGGGSFLAHHEILSDFRIWLREACAEIPALRAQFVPAWEEVRLAGSRRRRVAVRLPPSGEQYIPDGVFTIAREHGSVALFILEVDRATEPLERASGSSIGAKLRMFRSIFDEGFSQYSELFGRQFGGARILWVVPDRKRSASILDLACREDLADVAWSTEATSLQPKGSLRSQVWSVAGHDSRMSLVD